MAQSFDLSSGELKEQGTVLNSDAQVDDSVWRGTFSASENGTMIYQPGAAGRGMQLTWFDIHGKETGKLGEPDDYYQIELSPDGKKAAAAAVPPTMASGFMTRSTTLVPVSPSGRMFI